jgi:hypothetical protein
MIRRGQITITLARGINVYFSVSTRPGRGLACGDPD